MAFSSVHTWADILKIICINLIEQLWEVFSNANELQNICGKSRSNYEYHQMVIYMFCLLIAMITIHKM